MLGDPRASGWAAIVLRAYRQRMRVARRLRISRHSGSLSSAATSVREGLEERSPSSRSACPSAGAILATTNDRSLISRTRQAKRNVTAGVER